MKKTMMTRQDAMRILKVEPQRRFHVLFRNDPGMAINEIGQHVSMRGFIPCFEFDQAFEIAEKFNGEVA